MIMYPRMITMSFLFAKTSVLALWSVKTFISKGYAVIKDVDDKMAQQRAARAHSAVAVTVLTVVTVGVV